MYNFYYFIKESRNSYLEIFYYFHDIFIKFLEKHKDDPIGYHFFYENKDGVRSHVMPFDEMYYIINNGKRNLNIEYKLKLYGDIFNKAVIGIKYTHKTSNKGSFVKKKGILGEKYYVLISEHIPKGGPALKKFKKENGTISYLLEKFKMDSVKQSLFHEFIHLIDKLKIEDKGLNTDRLGYKNIKYDKDDKGKKNFDIYYNSTPEFNARVTSAFMMVKKEDYNSFEEFKNNFMKYLSDDFKNSLNDYNKRRLLKVIYNFYINNE